MTAFLDGQVAEISFTIYRGADFTLPLDFQQDNGLPLDLTDATAIAKLRRHFIEEVATFEIAIAEPTSGVIELSLSKAVIDGLKPATYSWSLFLTDAAGVTQLKCQGTVWVVLP
ncbi:MAG TPA: hypothetical protein V6C57_22725 [Coleofasciculaceae cyanobacterium]